MAVDLEPLEGASKLLFQIPLVPVQGSRFQPTGFPSLGAATFQTAKGPSLLIESPQSMANRLEAVCWDEAENRPRTPLGGISYVRVERAGKYLTSSITEPHRLNSPYLLAGSNKDFLNLLKEHLGRLEEGPIDRGLLARQILRFDVGSLIHGVFLEKIGGRLRLARALSAFIEADGVRPAVSGGVKNDHVNPSGDTKQGFGNVPFAREEFTAERILLYVNLDLAQIRGYDLGDGIERLLVVLALWKLRSLLENGLRLRTACDLEPRDGEFPAVRPEGFMLPPLADLDAEVTGAIAACKKEMEQTVVKFEDELKKSKAKKEVEEEGTGDDATAEENA